MRAPYVPGKVGEEEEEAKGGEKARIKGIVTIDSRYSQHSNILPRYFPVWQLNVGKEKKRAAGTEEKAKKLTFMMRNEVVKKGKTRIVWDFYKKTKGKQV